MTTAATRRRIDVARLQAAVWGAPGAPASDFDLNPGSRDALPRNRRLTPASVLVPIIERPNGLHVVLTRRADHLKRHAGQIAFPGGKVDPTDASPLAAALREAREEIGLIEELVDALGPIDTYETGTGFRVAPFVGVVEARFHPDPDPGEVAEVFEAPLDYLMDPANRRRGSRTFKGRRRMFWSIPFDGRDIWGATAGMLVSLSERFARLEGGA